MKPTHRRYHVWLALPALLILAWAGVAHAQSSAILNPLIDSPAENHPAYGALPGIETFDDQLLPLWLSAMQRNDPELRRLAAATITRAHRKGMPGLAEGAAKPLMDLLKAEDQPMTVYTAAAEALIALEVTDAAPTILAMNEKQGGAFAQLTDPALAAWDYKPAQTLWNQRIADDLTPTALRISAIDAVTTIDADATEHDENSVAALVALTARRYASSLRLAAARALGRLVDAGLFQTFETMARSNNVIDQIVAIEAIGSHVAPNSQQLLIILAGDTNPVVAGAAARCLIRVDPSLLARQAETLAKRDDINLRVHAVTILTDRADADAVTTLTQLLGDVNPAVRDSARESLMSLAQASLGNEVRESASKALQSDRWQAREQAALIVGKLDYEKAGRSLVDLLRDERFEVRIAAIAALRWIEIDAHNAAVLARLEEAMGDTDEDGRIHRYAEISQLTQYLGVMRYAEADATLQKFIPKKSAFGGSGRIGAIWSLGMIHEGDKDARLAGQFAARLRDWQGMEPEGNDVRAMSAIAIGMLEADGQLGVLESFYDGEMKEPDISRACRWSILQIKPDRVLSEDEAASHSSSDYFLIPLHKR